MRRVAQETPAGVPLAQRASMQVVEPGERFELESGAHLSPITVAYETLGELSRTKDNVILIAHALSGDAHVAGRYRPDEAAVGWWDDFVGPGRAIDTDRYFVICSNVLGGCRGTTGPGSINVATGRRYGMSFPTVTIGDMVRVQARLLDRLGIDRVAAVIGGSMGGMQAIEWAISFPERVGSAIVIASTSRLSAQSIAFNAVGRNAITSDPRWCGGDYYDNGEPLGGLAVARMIGHITYLSDSSMQEKFGRALREAEKLSYGFDSEFAVETYLDYQGAKFVERFDGNSYLYITKAMDYYDPAAECSSLAEALAPSKARWLVVSYTGDWLFPTAQSRELVDALLVGRKRVSFVELESAYGHDAFLLEYEPLATIVSGFIQSVRDGKK